MSPYSESTHGIFSDNDYIAEGGSYVSSPRYHLRSPGFYGPFDMLFGDHNSGRRGGIFYDEDASIPYTSIYTSSSTD